MEKKFGYNFQNKDLLIRALTHSTYAYENKGSDFSDNEVLEFLGDSVLGLIISDYLFSCYPDLSEGDLTKLKSTTVSTSSLFSIAKKLKLDKYVLLGKGEEKSGGRKKKTILAGTIEALVAAIYLDGGLEKARAFLLSVLKPLLNKANIDKFFINNYKSALQEYLQKESLSSPVYKAVTAKGPNHKKSFVVEVFSNDKPLATAKGSSKKEAEIKAAQKALKRLWGMKIKALTPDTFLLKKEHD